MNPGGEYPGRQIFAGALRTGEPAFAYFGSGRSPESQERLAVLAADALSVSIRPLRQVPHDKYRHYDAVKIDSETGAAVVSNSQKPLAEAFEACARFAKSGQSSNELQQTLLKILKAIGPEDDERRTPRILGAVLPNKNLNALAFASESETVCITFPAKPGEFLFVQTYNGIAAGPFDASMLRIGRTVFRTNAANAEQLSVDIYEASDYEDARHGELRVWCAAGVKGDSGWDLKIINKHSARDPLYTKTVAKHPESLIGEKIARELRYGSNPAQPAALYNPESFLGSLREMRTGKEGPSLSNIEDIYYAALTAGYFSEPCVIIMKHANPCGFAVQRRPEPLSLTFMKARDCDYRAAFGGTVFFNVPLDRQTAEEMKSNFTEVVVAPGFDDGVIEMLEGSTRAYQYDEKKFASMPRFSGESSEDEIRRLADG
ncbi:MAG: hypothetical protein HY368_02540, partial [Candidatus Aenigmarchaeota archaeon]|nr:hypothetical protein [Candidatus Aenigmarchaeota archaeon]